MEMNKDTIIGKVESANVVKTGTTEKDGKSINWSRLEVIINGQKFTTFDKEFLAMIGIEGSFDFKIEDRISPRGTSYQSRTLFPLPKPKKDAVDIVVMEVLKRIEQKLDWISGRISPIPEPEDFQEGEETNLPF